MSPFDNLDVRDLQEPRVLDWEVSKGVFLVIWGEYLKRVSVKMWWDCWWSWWSEHH